MNFQKFSHSELEKLIRKYDAMPDIYYTDTVPVGPGQLGNRSWMHRLGYQPGDTTQLWEWMAGSASLSAAARTDDMTHLPPIDHRWGYHVGATDDQEKLIYVQLIFGTDVLFAAPTCTPWGGHARGWDKDNRTRQRDAQQSTLQFLAVACVIQMCLGRFFVIENPHASDIWSESVLRRLRTDSHLTVLDQCQFGAKLEGEFILKATDLLSNVCLPGLAKGCDGSHRHLVLRGTNKQGSRTAQSAVYPSTLCSAMLNDFVG